MKRSIEIMLEEETHDSMRGEYAFVIDGRNLPPERTTVFSCADGSGLQVIAARLPDKHYKKDVEPTFRFVYRGISYPCTVVPHSIKAGHYHVSFKLPKETEE